MHHYVFNKAVIGSKSIELKLFHSSLDSFTCNSLPLGFR